MDSSLKGLTIHAHTYLITFSFCGAGLWLAEPLKAGTLSVFTPRLGVTGMRAGLIRRSCMSHFTHTSQVREDGFLSYLIPSYTFPKYTCVSVCLTWNGIIRGAWQQEMELFSVSSLLLKPCLEHSLHSENVVLHLLQVDFSPQQKRVCRSAHRSSNICRKGKQIVWDSALLWQIII